MAWSESKFMPLLRRGRRRVPYLVAAFLVLLQACATYPPVPPAARQSAVASAPPRQVAPASPASIRPGSGNAPAADRAAKPVTPPVVVDRVTPAPAAVNLMARAEQALQGGDVDAALLWLERAQRLSPQAGDVYLAMGDAKERLGLFSEAEQLYLKARSLAGSDRVFRDLVDKRLARVRRRKG